VPGVLEIVPVAPDTIRISGRLDAASAPQLQAALDSLDGSCVIDCAGLDYVSSAGLGVFLATYKRLSQDGHVIRLVGMKKLVRDIFRYSRMDTIFRLD
jgi:anti-anti-sigma factor